MTQAMDVANYFIVLRDIDKRNGRSTPLTNKRLQKLLYLAQLAHFDYTGNPLITGTPFEAWKSGPVLWKVYQTFEEYDKDTVRYKERHRASLTKFERSLIEETWTIYFGATDDRLQEIIEDSLPWKRAREAQHLFIKDDFFATLV